MEQHHGRRTCPGFNFAVLHLLAVIVLAFGTASSAEETPGRQFLQPSWTGIERFAALDNGASSDARAPAHVSEPEQGTGYPVVDWAVATFVDGASVTLGWGVRRSSFTITRKSDRASGTIVDRDYPAAFVVYSTKPTLIGDSSVGYTFMLRLSSFNMDQQIASGASASGVPTDVQSNINGAIGYALPSLYYQWGGRRKTGTYFQIGAGLGLTTMTYSGTIELQTAAGAESISVRDNSLSLDLAWGTFLDARWRHMGIYLSFMRSHLPGDSYDTTFEDVSLYLGYQLIF